MEAQYFTLRLADGRNLMYLICGDPNGIPVFYFHGSGLASGHMAKMLANTAESLHIKIIAPDRPGIGGSDPQPDRKLPDWPIDVAALADFLKINSFSILCESGGATYAYSCAYQMPDRVQLISVASGIVPFDLSQLKKGVPLGKRLSTHLARGIMTRSPGFIIQNMFKNTHQALQKDSDTFLEKAFSKAPQAEKQYFQSQRNRDVFASAIKHTYQNGYSGTAADLRICLGHWHIPVEKLSLPVQLWHGKLDKTVPAEYAENMSRYLKNCTARFFPEDTHLSLLRCHADEILMSIREAYHPENV